MASTNQDIPILGPVLKALFGTRNERFVKRYTQHVQAIAALEPEIRRLSDEEIRAKTAEFRRRFKEGAKPADLMDEIFAVAREAMDRAIGIRSVLNPKHRDEFSKDQLPQNLRAVYENLCQEADAMEPAPPEGEFAGSAEPIPGWRRVSIPVELYEAVREIYPTSRPPFRSRPFDVQIIGAMVLSQGKIAEMKTGEGKTIVAPLAAYLAALEDRKVHVVTVNDYLVQRDRDWTFPFFHAVGMTVGAIHPSHMQPEEVKRTMYDCDVVYGTTSEFGFDYLRDNMKRSVEQQVQRRRDFAIVDEVDSILIDEARTPLIISGPAHDDQPRYELADSLARRLVEKQRPWNEANEKVEACKRRIKGLEGDIRNARDRAKVPELQAAMKQAKDELPRLERERDQHMQYYEVELEKKQAHLTHHGVSEAQKAANIGSFYVGENIDMPHLLENSLRAYAVYQLDRDYVVMDVPDRMTGQTQPSIVIVDTFTGRPMIGRQWSDGLHQAVEAKERVPIKQETQTVATVTIQNFYKMYKRLAGMTGTADTEAQEFRDIYGLDVVSIPTNLPVIRRDFNDTVFLSAKDKWEAIVDEIKNFHDVGRPVLVGTTSVERSEMLGKMLTKKHGVKHEVLNAKQHEREAHIVENAGQLGAVMIATNMAGRGTDIKLGRITRAQLLEHWQKRGIAPRDLTTDATDEQVREAVYRKVAPKELGVSKEEARSMDAGDLEVRLLRKWATEYTWLTPGQVEKMGPDALREELDAQGRFMLHRIGWVDTIEGLGGLHVIGTERHESRRIDNQLRGRSGRQGDRGSTRFFVSLEDDLMKMFAGETTMKILARLGMREGDAIEHPILTKSVERAQRKVEERNFQIRKNILEYDEVMEHQRQAFYGTRQRVLEGREVKALIFEYLEDAIRDACDTYLDPGYPAECAAEFARQRLNCSIPAERLRGRDESEIETAVRRIAKDEFRAMIQVTLGEYIGEGDAGAEGEGEGEESGHDLQGLSNWAAREFGVEIAANDLREMQPRAIEDRLIHAAQEKVDEADLSGVAGFLEQHYGARELASWVRNVLGFEVSLEELIGPESDKEFDPAGLLIERAQEAYEKREAEYPVEFVMDMTTGLMRFSPDQAMAGLVRFANERAGLDWKAEDVRTKMPQQIRDDLLRAMRASTGREDAERLADEAAAIEDPDELETHLREKLRLRMPRFIRWLDADERRDAVRGLVLGSRRPEMVQFEQFVLVENLDSIWKDHLYAMDQLRDAIGFRAFSQQDPRIEFKREGARLFGEMQQRVRDRVADQVFKLKLSPQAAIQQQMLMMQAQQARARAQQQSGQPRPQAAPAGVGAPPAPGNPGAMGGGGGGMRFGSGTISGPGFGGGGAPRPPAGPSSSGEGGGATT